MFSRIFYQLTITILIGVFISYSSCATEEAPLFLNTVVISEDISAEEAYKLGRESYIEAKKKVKPRNGLESKLEKFTFFMPEAKEERLELYRRAFEFFEIAAGKGSLDAECMLGLLHQKGRGVKKDCVEAAYWYHKSAEQDHKDAQYRLGKMHQVGEGIPKDLGYATQFLIKAANKAHAAAACALGNIFFHGSGSIAKNIYEARKWYEKAAQEEYKEALEALGEIHSNAYYFWDEEKAIDYYYRAALQGSSKAVHNLANLSPPRAKYLAGIIFYEGKGVPKNATLAHDYLKEACQEGHKEAIEFLEKEALLGSADLQFALADVISKIDVPRALRLYEKSAEQGYSKAQVKLGNLYLEENNITQALYWYAQASKDYDARQKIFEIAAQGRREGHPEAKYLMGIIYDKDSSKTREEVAYWFKKAAIQGHRESYFRFGLMCVNGDGIDQSPSQGVAYLEKAAEQNHFEAQYYLARIYREGSRGVPANVDLAFKWFSKSANANHIESQFCLGLIYQENKKDDIKAAEWLLKAAYQGHLEAQKNIAKLFLEGRGVLKDKKNALTWLAKAAQQGDLKASSLIVKHQHSYDDQNDTIDPSANFESLREYKNAAKQGDKRALIRINTLAQDYFTEAIYTLAQAYHKGWGIAKDENQAVLFYKAAARQGYFKGWYAIAAQQLKNIPSIKKESKFYGWLATLSGEESTKRYLSFMKKSSGRKDRKKLKALQEQGLPKEGYYKAQLELADLYIKGNIIHFTSISATLAAYEEADRLYSLAARNKAASNKIEYPLGKWNEVYRTLAQFRELKDTIDAEDFKHKLFLEQHREQKLNFYVLNLIIAFIFNKAHHFSPVVEKRIQDILFILPSNLYEDDEMKGIVIALYSLIRSEEFNKNRFGIKQRYQDDDRLKKLGGIESAVNFLTNNSFFSFSLSILEGNLKVSEKFLRDPRIEAYNSLLIGRTINYNKEIFRRSTEKILYIFDILEAQGKLSRSCLEKEEKEPQNSLREDLKKLITYKGKPTNRFAHRLIQVADIIQEKFKDSPDLIASQLVVWAERGRDCLAASEGEISRFYIDYVTNAGKVSGLLAKEERSLEIEVAISLAKLRHNLLDSMVKEKDQERVHSVQYLIKKAGEALGLLGDSQDYADLSEKITVSPKYKGLEESDILNNFLKIYTPDVMVNHIAEAFNKGGISCSKLHTRLQFQILKEKLSPNNELDSTLFKNEFYTLKVCTSEDFYRHLKHIPSLFSSQDYLDWGSLKARAYKDAMYQMGEQFYDEDYNFTLKGARAILKGMGYLEEALQ